MNITTDLKKVQREFSKCAKDCFYFATHYVYTFDQSRGQKSLVPEWDYVEMILNEIAIPGDLYLEKSRDMMVSWTVMIYFLHSMLFNENWAGFAISRKQDEVDDGGDNSTPESLFGRIKFMWQNLPFWMKPNFTFSHLKIKNKDTDSYCTGESANPNSGRNVACTFKFCDEFAFLPLNDQASINQAMRWGSYRTLLYVTTAKQGTLAETISREGKGFKKIQIPWHLRPDKDKAWYEKKSAGAIGNEVAEELDISYAPRGTEKVVAQYWDASEQIIDPDDMLPAGQYERIACGMDYGFIRSAVEFAGLYQNTWYVFHEIYEYEKTPDEMTALINHVRQSIGIDFAVFCGKDRPDLLKSLSMGGFVATGFQEPVGVRMGTIISVFKTKRIKIIGTATGLLTEIPRYRRHKEGGVVVDAPHRHDVDEAMDAIGYLFMGAGEHANAGEWESEWDDNPYELLESHGKDWSADGWELNIQKHNFRWINEYSR